MKYTIAILLCASVSQGVWFDVTEFLFSQTEEGDRCYDNKKEGVCTPAERCKAAQEDIKKGIMPTICGYNNTTAIVCCRYETYTPTGIRKLTKRPGEISEAKCKEYAQYSYLSIISPLLSTIPQQEKIYECHGSVEVLTISSLRASRKEYPHMAHIAYYLDVPPLKGYRYLCGGSLISEKFVLTAANCILPRGFKKEPKFVRLGVTNIDDTEHRQEINVAEYFIHPKDARNRDHHDIGLLKLEKPAVFNQFVRPACLNTIRNITYKTGAVSGWGQISSYYPLNNDLLKSILNIFPSDKCNDSYYNPIYRPDGVVEDLMICAGTISDQRKNSCYGDIGSPLQVRIQNSEELQCMLLITGITSSGHSCGLSGVSAVYTRVSAYIDWIEKIVWPELL